MPFISVEISSLPARTGWVNYDVIFSIYGDNWKQLYEVSENILRVCASPSLLKLGGATVTEGQNPVSESFVLNVGVAFGGVI